jgi:predicted regulator of Ras-like GTPase activity (Roadblock/LC7/MglB family)
MKHTELPRVIRVLKDPVLRFVHDARARIALLVSRSGQVLAQYGFTSSYEVMNVASLAAAAHASSQALAELTRSGRWTHLYHAGAERKMFLAPLDTPVDQFILVVIFDGQSSLGIVQLFFDQLSKRVAALPELQRTLERTDAASFERDLNAGLERMFPADARESR